MADEGQVVEAGLSAPATASDTVGHRNARTRAMQGAFLAAYAKSYRVDLAAEAAGIARSTHYNWLAEDREYPVLFREAEQLARQMIWDLAVQRATSGWDEPVFYEGKRVDTKRVFSERLLERFLEAKFPEFKRQHVELTGKDGTPLISLDAIAEIVRKAEAEDEHAGVKPA